MAGGYGFFVGGLVAGAERQRETLLALARRLPGISWVDAVAGELVRVHGGPAPRIEPLPPSEAAPIAEAVRALGDRDLSGWIGVHVPWDHLEIFAECGDLLVPGHPPESAGFGDYAIGDLDAAAADIDETLAEAREFPEDWADDEDYLEFMRGLRRAVEVAAQNGLILHGAAGDREPPTA